ncbi:MAG: acyl-CoA thioesterase [Crocinitomicaceae bacterium]
MISTPIQVRFADCDMAGHIHNGAYLHYFETGRIMFFVNELGKNWDWRKQGLIIKKNTLVYHRPGHLEDQISITVGCCHIGNKSFTLTYKVNDAQNNLICEGESVVVCMNYSIGKTIEIPLNIKTVLEKHPSDPVEA